MTTSVPSVVSIEDLKWRVASVLEKSLELYRTTGDIYGLEQSVQLVRETYEELKIEGHKGKMSWDYINRYPPLIKRLEDTVSKARARNAK